MKNLKTTTPTAFERAVRMAELKKLQLPTVSNGGINWRKI